MPTEIQPERRPVVLIRWVGRAAMGLTSLAVALGHLNPPVPPDPARFASPERPVIVRGGECWRPQPGGLWVAPATGATSTLPLPSGGLMTNAAIAPWQDRQGRTQVIGCWLAHGTGDLAAGSYLARFVLPSGALLDASELASILDGTPCWFPGNPDRVLFAQQDGELYEITFRADDRPGQADRPRRLRWEVPRPLGEGSRVHSPTWPTGESLGGRVLVSIEPRVVGPRGPDFQQPWWLQLDRAGSSIEAAGPLLADDGAGRFPVVATGWHEVPHLAYLSRPEGASGFELRVAPIEFDRPAGAPTIRPENVRLLATNCHPTPPIFSSDGSSIFVVNAETTRFELRRLPLDHR